MPIGPHMHHSIGAALRDPTGWAALSTLAFSALSQGCPPDWARWCWLAAVVSGVLGILLRQPPAPQGGPDDKH